MKERRRRKRSRKRRIVALEREQIAAEEEKHAEEEEAIYQEQLAREAQERRAWEMAERALQKKQREEQALQDKLKQLSRSLNQKKRRTTFPPANPAEHEDLSIYGPVSTPLLPTMDQDLHRQLENNPHNCTVFLQAGLCPLGARCPQLHPTQFTSRVLLFPYLFSPLMQERSERKQDSDILLDSSEEYHLPFLEAANSLLADLRPELKPFGPLIQMKVSAALLYPSLPLPFHSFSPA